MKVDYINPVLIASSRIIKILLQEDVILGRLSRLTAITYRQHGNYYVDERGF